MLTEITGFSTFNNLISNEPLLPESYVRVVVHKYYSYEQSRTERVQIKLSIEPIAKRSQISGDIFSEIECMETSSQTGFEIAKYDVGLLVI